METPLQAGISNQPQPPEQNDGADDSKCSGIFPVTIAEILRNFRSAGSAVFVGAQVLLDVTLVAQVESIQTCSNKFVFTLDDKSGASIDANYWFAGNPPLKTSELPRLRTYISVFGTLTSSNGRVQLELTAWKPVNDPDIISLHVLRTVFAHHMAFNPNALQQPQPVQELSPAALQYEKSATLNTTTIPGFSVASKRIEISNQSGLLNRRDSKGVQVPVPAAPDNTLPNLISRPAITREAASSTHVTPTRQSMRTVNMSTPASLDAGRRTSMPQISPHVTRTALPARFANSTPRDGRHYSGGSNSFDAPIQSPLTQQRSPQEQVNRLRNENPIFSAVSSSIVSPESPANLSARFSAAAADSPITPGSHSRLIHNISRASSNTSAVPDIRKGITGSSFSSGSNNNIMQLAVRAWDDAVLTQIDPKAVTAATFASNPTHLPPAKDLTNANAHSRTSSLYTPTLSSGGKIMPIVRPPVVRALPYTPRRGGGGSSYLDEIASYGQSNPGFQRPSQQQFYQILQCNNPASPSCPPPSGSGVIGPPARRMTAAGDSQVAPTGNSYQAQTANRLGTHNANPINRQQNAGNTYSPSSVHSNISASGLRK